MGEIKQTGREVEDSTAIDSVARIGLLAYGFVHLLIGWLAVQLALGDRSENPSAQGAFHALAAQPAGEAAVLAVAVGMLLLVVVRLVEVAFGHREVEGAERLRNRLSSAGQAVVYAVLGLLAAKTALGSGGSGGEQGLTAQLMSLPAGQWLVVAVGAGILVVGGGFVWSGVTERFAEHLDTEGRLGTSGAVYLVVGRFGYIAKGVALALVGVLVCYAGATHRPSQSGGLDEALQKVLVQPFGPVLLVAVGAGFGCYGLFCLARSRHLSR